MHMKNASSSLCCWFWLAFFQCSEYVRELFRGDSQYNFPPIAERIYFVRAPCSLNGVWYTDRAFRRVRAPSCAAPRVRVPVFSHPSRSPEWYPLFRLLVLRSLEDSSACVASARVSADPVRQSTVNGMSAFCVQFPPTALQIQFPCWVFFLVADNSALITSCPVLEDFRSWCARCDRPGFRFTDTSVSCGRGRVMRLNSVFFLPLFKGRRSFGVQF